jgi:hypothetical protein
MGGERGIRSAFAFFGICKLQKRRHSCIHATVEDEVPCEAQPQRPERTHRCTSCPESFVDRSPLCGRARLGRPILLRVALEFFNKIRDLAIQF